MKKILSVLLSLALLCAYMPLGAVSVAAATSGTTGDCTWTLDDNGHLTISGNGAMGDYDDECGPWGNDITAVTIENGVTTIGDCAFFNCSSLTSVDIGDNVATIGNSAFISCFSLITLTIPDSVITVGDKAFDSCISLISVDIGDSVTTIGNRAFNFCQRLKSVTIGSSITTIGWDAFNSCTALTSVTIPDSVTTIMGAAFYWCYSLTDVYYSGSEEDRAAISVEYLNSYFLDATWHYNYGVCFHEYAYPCDQYCALCGELSNPDAAHSYDSTCDPVCNACGEERVPPHEYDHPYDPDCNVCGATREVPEVMAGDANGDGKVNIRDLGLLQQFLNGWDIGVLDAVCDVNADGKVNIRDLGLLQQYLNGWDVTLQLP